MSRPEAVGAKPRGRFVEQTKNDVSAPLFGPMLGWKDVRVAERFVGLEVVMGDLSAQTMVEPFSDHSAEGQFEFLFTGKNQVFAREEPGCIQSYLHTVIDAAEVGELEVEKAIGQVLSLEHHEAVRLLHVGGEFS